MERNRFVHYGLVLLIIAAVSAGCLAGVNKLTKPTIEKNNIAAANAARIEVLPQAASFDETQKLAKDDLEFIPGFDSNGNLVGYVSVVGQNGYGGVVVFSLGMDVEGKITGLKIMNHQETPGLGSKITNLDWQQSWAGRDVTYEFDKAVDGFAGATVSPQAVHTGIQRALTVYGEVSK